MRLQEMVKPALFGVLAGGVMVLVAGFGMEILVTANSARDQATSDSARAVAEVMTPYCVAAAHADPVYSTLLEEMKTVGAYRRVQIVSKAGWATPMGAKGPHAALADACQLELLESA